MNSFKINEPFVKENYEKVSQDAVNLVLTLSRMTTKERKQGLPLIAEKMNISGTAVMALVRELVDADIARIEKVGV